MLPAYERIFWANLSHDLAWSRVDVRGRVEALHWLADAIASDTRTPKRSSIVRVLEDSVIDVLWTIYDHNVPIDAVRSRVYAQLVPLMEGPLQSLFHPHLRQLIGVLLGNASRFQATHNYEVPLPDGTTRVVSITERQEVAAAIRAYRKILKGGIEPDSRLGQAFIESRIRVPIPDFSEPFPAPVKIPLVLLLVHAPVDMHENILKRLHGFFSLADPKIGQAIQSTLATVPPKRTSDQRRQAYVRVMLEYVRSIYFSLIREFSHGLQRLRDSSLTEFDNFTGFSGIGPTPHTTEAILDHVFSAGSVPITTRRGLSMLRVRDLSDLQAFAAASLDALPLEGPDQVILRLMRQASSVISPFDALWHFLAIAALTSRLPTIVSRLPNTVSPGIWLRDYVLRVLHGASGTGDHAGVPEGRDETIAEVLRRSRAAAHAASLRVAFLATTSPLHLAEIGKRVPSANDFVSNWLLRALALADRLLVIGYHGLGWSSQRIAEGFRSAVEAFGVEVSAQEVPDIFNPFFYGPDDYDHEAAALLAILDVIAGAPGDIIEAPFLTDERVTSALGGIAGKALTDGERAFDRARLQRKPNHLDLGLDRLPQEMAYSILGKLRSPRR